MFISLVAWVSQLLSLRVLSHSAPLRGNGDDRALDLAEVTKTDPHLAVVVSVQFLIHIITEIF